MALSKKLSLICGITSLLPLASAAILPFQFGNAAIQKTLEDNDDTPIPLVIWHGLSPFSRNLAMSHPQY